MKTLLLMRHGKSSWKHPDLSDQERPLSKRGERDTHFMSHFIVERELVPQVVLASSSKRTAKTAEALCEDCAGIGPLRLMDELYLAEAGAYIDALRTLPAGIERALIIGHNPGLESLLMILGRRIEAMPTASLAHLVLPIQSWSDLTQETEGELVDFWKPQDLQQQQLEDEENKKEKKEEKKKDEKKDKHEPKKDKKEKKDKKKKKD